MTTCFLTFFNCDILHGKIPSAPDQHIYKMATILQTIFANAFCWMKNVFWFKCQWGLCARVQLQLGNIGSDNGLVRNKPKAIVWTNDDISHSPSVSYHIEAEIKWPPLCRRHYQTHFLWVLHPRWQICCVIESRCILIEISLKFVPKGPINNIPTLVQIMAWRRPNNTPLSEPMMVRLPTHICVTRPQWANVGHNRTYGPTHLATHD